MSSAPLTTNPATTGFTEEAFEAFLRERDEPAWLVERRREAFARFQAFALPSARDEEWRRTDIRASEDRRVRSAVPSANPARSTAMRSSKLWQSLSAHYATGIAHIAGRSLARPIRRCWDGRSSSTWTARSKTIPSCSSDIF